MGTKIRRISEVWKRYLLTSGENVVQPILGVEDGLRIKKSHG